MENQNQQKFDQNDITPGRHHPFGVFPGETNVQLAECPICKTMVTHSALDWHIKMHDKPAAEIRPPSKYKFPTESPFVFDKNRNFICSCENKYEYVIQKKLQQ